MMTTTKKTRNYYTQRQWDRIVGWGKVPKEYQMPSSEDMLIERILQNELDTMKVLRNEQYTDEDVVVRNWMKKRIEDLTNEDE